MISYNSLLFDKFATIYHQLPDSCLVFVLLKILDYRNQMLIFRYRYNTTTYIIMLCSQTSQTRATLENQCALFWLLSM